VRRGGYCASEEGSRVLVTGQGSDGRWKFAHPGTHGQFAASDLTKLLLDGGFLREELCLQSVSLAWHSRASGASN